MKCVIISQFFSLLWLIFVFFAGFSIDHVVIDSVLLFRTRELNVFFIFCVLLVCKTIGFFVTANIIPILTLIRTDTDIFSVGFGSGLFLLAQLFGFFSCLAKHVFNLHLLSFALFLGQDDDALGPQVCESCSTFLVCDLASSLAELKIELLSRD